MGIGNNGTLPGPGPGWPKGKQNKVTVELKNAIMNAFDKVGGEDYLVKLANERPELFVPLLAKVLPAELKVKEDGSLVQRILEARERARLYETGPSADVDVTPGAGCKLNG